MPPAASGAPVLLTHGQPQRARLRRRARRATGKPVVVTIASEEGWSLVGVMGSSQLDAAGAIALVSARGLDAAVRPFAAVGRRTERRGHDAASPAERARSAADARTARRGRCGRRAAARRRASAAPRDASHFRNGRGADAPTGHFILHSNVMPPITAGRYELVTEQTGLPFDVAPEHTHLHVAAPRYTMPTDQILSSFPPANARGRVRRPAAADRAQAPHAAVGAQPRRRRCSRRSTPWLALVVVAEGEAAALDGHAGGATASRRARRCSTREDKDVEQGLYLAVTETVVKKIFPVPGRPAAARARARGRHQRHRARQRRRRRLARRGAGQPAAGVRPGERQARALHGLPRQRGRPARRAAAAAAAGGESSNSRSRRTGRCSRRSTPRGGPDPRVMGGVGAGQCRAACRRRAARATARGPRRRPRPCRPVRGVGPRWARRSTARRRWRRQPVAEQWVAGDPAGGRGGARPRRQAPGARHHGAGLPLPDRAVRAWRRCCASQCWRTGRSPPTKGATFETLMQDLDVGLLGTAAQNCRRTRRRPTRSPRSCRQATSAWTTARAAATRCAPGTAGRACPSPRARDSTAKNEAARARALGRSAAARDPRRPRGPVAGRRVRDRPAARAVAALDGIGAAALSRRAVRRRPRARGALTVAAVRAAGAGGRARRPWPASSHCRCWTCWRRTPTA